MTKAERLTITTMTAKAWHILHLEELNNAHSATSWAHYQELNSNKYMHGLRSEWASLSELCEALHIDMNDDSTLDSSVATIMQKCFDLSTEALAIYSQFSDYPYRTDTDSNETEFEYHVENFESIKQTINSGKSTDTMPVRGNITLEVIRDGDFVYADLRDYSNDNDTFVAGWVYSLTDFLATDEADFNRVVTSMYNNAQ